MAEMQLVRLLIGDIAEPNPHIVHYGRRNGDRKADSAYGVRNRQRKDVAGSHKNETCNQAPKQSNRRQYWIRKMGNGKDDCRYGRSCCRVGKNAQKANQKIALQQKLLCQRPNCVAAKSLNPLRGAAGMVQCVEADCDGCRGNSDQQCDRNDP